MTVPDGYFDPKPHLLIATQVGVIIAFILTVSWVLGKFLMSFSTSNDICDHKKEEPKYSLVASVEEGRESTPLVSNTRPASSDKPSEPWAEIAPYLAQFLFVIVCYTFTSTTDVFAAKKFYDDDLFWGLHLLLLLASFLTVSKTTERSGTVLNRDQTEEWKGWMQVIFLAYHYYNAGTVVYNMVRVLIGAYVWMTGFGHFVYFFTKKNFDFVRVMRTLLRLNTLVIFACLATGNEYMLYYICPMHTFWFFVVFAVMWVGHKHNSSPLVIPAKLALTFVLITILYETPGLFQTVFSPLKFMLSFEGKGLHEWEFRTGLDRYAAWLGMVCGYALPHFQKFMDSLETQPVWRQWAFTKAPITIALLAASWIWLVNVFNQDKFNYNKSHPYFEFIPILTWLWLRNCTLTLRNYHLSLFSFWGKVTLESYISQLHILLTRNAKAVLLIFPGHRLISMIVCTLFFGFASKALFDSTVKITDTLAPMDDARTTIKRTGVAVCVGVGLCLAGAGVVRFM